MCYFMCSVRSSTYKEKLSKLKLRSLQARRVRQQLSFMFKMKRGLIDLCFENFFQENKYKRTRGNRYKLVLPTFVSLKRNTVITSLYARL